MEPTAQQREVAEKYFIKKYLGTEIENKHSSLMGKTKFKQKCTDVEAYIIWDEAEEQQEHWIVSEMYLVEVTLYDSDYEKIKTEYDYIQWAKLS